MVAISKIGVYYSSFFHGHLFRDYRFISDTGKAFNFKFPDEPLQTQEMKRKALNFLISHVARTKSREGILSSSLSFFKDIGEYRTNNDVDRYTDRLMFDFDTENVKINNLKDKLKKAYAIKEYKPRRQEIKKVQYDFQKLLYHSNVLSQPFKEAEKLRDHLQQLNVPVYTVFSGCKGLHLYVFLPKLHLPNISQVTAQLAFTFKEKLDLKTLDVSVSKDSLKRIDRVPYSLNEKTRLYATPFNLDDDIKKVVKASKNQRVTEFDFKDYMLAEDNALVKFLLKQNKYYGEINEAKKNTANFNRTRREAVGDYNVSSDELFTDMRNLAKVVLGTPVKEYKAYNTYLCPFHDDHYPSARVYKRNFRCEACNVHFRYFDFIKNYYRLQTDKETKAKMREIRAKLHNEGSNKVKKE